MSRSSTPQKIRVRELLADIRAEATDEFLMKKYALTEKGIQSLFKKLVETEAVTQSELDRRISSPLKKPLSHPATISFEMSRMRIFPKGKI